MHAAGARPLFLAAVATVATIWSGPTAAAPGAARPPEGVPSARLEADSTDVRLGDLLLLRLYLQYDESALPLPPGPPVVSTRASLLPGAVEKQTSGDGIRNQTHHFTLRLYEMGSHRVEIPALAFLSSAGDTIWRQPAPLEIEVAGVRETGDNELRDIKPPLPSLRGVPLWAVAVLAGVAFILAAWLVKWWLDRGAGEEALPPPSPVNYPAEFSRIAAMGLLERGAFKTYYSLLSEVLRHFVEDRLGVEAMERTTAEIAAAVGQTEALDPALADRAMALLDAADLVKFACAIPTLDEARAAAEEGRAAVQAIDGDLARRRARAEAAERDPTRPDEPVAAEGPGAADPVTVD